MKLNPWKYYDSLMSLSRRDYKDGWQLPDFYYGINKISNNVGTLNCDLYRKQGEDREKVKTGISNKLLNRRRTAFTTRKAGFLTSTPACSSTALRLSCLCVLQNPWSDITIKTASSGKLCWAMPNTLSIAAKKVRSLGPSS